MSLDMNELEEMKSFLKERISELLNLPLQELSDTTELAELYDSVSMVTLMVELEEKYSVSYEIQELIGETFGSVEKIVNSIVQKRLVNAGGSSL